jgi:hypothetical protein
MRAEIQSAVLSPNHITFFPLGFTGYLFLNKLSASRREMLPDLAPVILPCKVDVQRTKPAIFFIKNLAYFSAMSVSRKSFFGKTSVNSISVEIYEFLRI